MADVVFKPIEPSNDVSTSRAVIPKLNWDQLCLGYGTRIMEYGSDVTTGTNTRISYTVPSGKVFLLTHATLLLNSFTYTDVPTAVMRVGSANTNAVFLSIEATPTRILYSGNFYENTTVVNQEYAPCVPMRLLQGETIQLQIYLPNTVGFGSARWTLTGYEIDARTFAENF